MTELQSNIQFVLNNIIIMCQQSEQDAEMFGIEMQDLLKDACDFYTNTQFEFDENPNLTEVQEHVCLAFSILNMQAQEDTDSTEHIAEVLDSVLDNIRNMDGFGTEGECDPRGDFRNGDWSMWDVESE